MCRNLFFKITYYLEKSQRGALKMRGHACLKKTKASEKYENVITS